jgi:hypothetical protein
MHLIINLFRLRDKALCPTHEGSFVPTVSFLQAFCKTSQQPSFDIWLGMCCKKEKKIKVLARSTPDIIETTHVYGMLLASNESKYK